jgi:hypothetical protein
MRETIVVLDSETALNTGVSAAVADKHKIARVRMSPKVHNSVVHNIQWGRFDNDPVMQSFCHLYDASARADLKHGDECGTLYGAPVVLDDSLATRYLVIESVPY